MQKVTLFILLVILTLPTAGNPMSMMLESNNDYLRQWSSDVSNIVHRLAVQHNVQAAKQTDQEEICLREITGTRRFLNEVHGYCLLVPYEYLIGQPNRNELWFYKDSPLDVDHPKLIVKVQDTGGRSLEQLVDEFIDGYEGFEIQRYANIEINGEEAVLLEGVPGQDLTRQVFTVHQGRLYTLVFIPDDKNQDVIYHQLKQFYKIVMDSFRFLTWK